MRRLLGIALIAGMAWSGAGGAGVARAAGYSALTLPLVSGGERPDLLIAQRTIERSWGPSEDSVYVEFDVPEWRSEGAALALSAAVPGLGQAYAGDRRRGLWFALAEAAGWTVRQIHRQRGRELRDDAARYAGVPTDSTSKWSFTRWARETQADPTELEGLYAADRDVFYDLIASDPRYLGGWEGSSVDARTYFGELRRTSDARLRTARYAGVVLWINHVAAAVEALRAARLQNLPLTPNTGLKVRSGWHAGSPSVRAMIERKF